MSTVSVFAGQSALPAPNDPLVSSDDFVEEFKVTSPTAADLARIESALEIASADCRSETNQQLSEVIETITLRPLYDGQLILPEWPVTALGPLVLDGTTLADGTDYTWTDRGIVTPITFCLRSSTPAPRTIAVTYTHGWNPLPRDIAGVCLARAKRWYDAPNAQPIESETLGQWSVKYAPVMDGLTLAEKYTLSRYASWTSWTNGY